MSYLNTLRLHFAGRFFSDPSTVNNHPGHYNNALFDRARHWRRGLGGSVDHGWWNPEGANLFKLRNVKVTSAIGADGMPLAAGNDPVLGLAFVSRDGRSAAKMVDLDPDQQLVSMIYGLTVALTDSAGHVLMQGTLEPAPFSDIWSRGRGELGIGGDERACVFYQTVVQVTTWGDLGTSPFLQQLRQAAGDSLLALKFQLDGYSMASPNTDRRFTGRIVGTLAGASASEPRHWQPGRHFAGGSFPAFTASPGFSPPANYGVAVLDQARGKVRVDLGNALVIDIDAAPPPDSPVADHGRLSLVGLRPNGSEVEIGEIPYGSPGWYENTAGIAELPANRSLTTQEMELFESLPLAIVAERPPQGGQRRLLVEPDTHVRADMFVARVNPGASVVLHFRASKLGKPLANERLRFQHYLPSDDPRFPASALTFPAEVICDADGKASVTFSAADPGAVRFFFSEEGLRQHVDGQVYRVAYFLGNKAPANPSDFLSILVWNEFRPDEPPTWHGSMQPVFVQYGNLYPFMTTQGAGISAPAWLDLADYEQVADPNNRGKIIKVLELAETDPHYMPVTRDLSRSKLLAMLRWLRNLGPDGKPLRGTAAPAGPEIAKDLAAPAEAAIAEAAPAGREEGSKTIAGRKVRMQQLIM